MKTGLESLDTGAPEITYSGNQGPKSPQEDQQKMAEFELQEYMEEFERVFPDMKNKRGTPDYMKELQDYFEGLASKQSEGIGDMAMKSGLIDEYRNYKMGQEDAGQPFMSPREYYRSLEQDRMGVKEGGIMRTAFQGGGMDAGAGSNFGSENFGGGGDNNREQYGASGQYTRAKDTSFTTADQDRNQRAVVAAAIAENKKIAEQKELEKFIEDQEKFSAIKKGIEKRTLAKKLKLADVASIKNLYDEDDSEDARLDYISDFDKGRFAKSTPETMKQLGDYRDVVQKSLQPGINPTLKIGLNTVIPFLGTGAEMLYNKYYDPFGYSKTKTTPTTTGGDGNNMNLYIPPMTMADVAGTGTDTAKKDIEDEFIANFLQPNRNLSESDLARINRIGAIQGAADGGRIGYADGGITDLRQGYFLGKLVKKATRGLKKIVKSPLGKAALLGFGMFGIPSGSGLTGGLFKSEFGKKIGMKMLMDKNATDFSFANLDPIKAGILGASALTGLYAKQDQDDEPSLDEYLGSANRGPSIDPRGIREYIAMNKGNINPMDYSFLNPSYYAADGGRIGLAAGGIGDLRGALSKEMFNLGEEDDDEIKKLALGGSAGLPPVTMQPSGQDAQSFGDDESTGIAQATPTTTLPNQMPRPKPMIDPRMMQQMMMQQRMNPMMARGMMQQPRIMAQEGGMMDMGGMEKDYRNEGGFVPIGGQERADDVPARLSKNEFVFTADAVRNAGGGDIDKGAEIMENMMENLEAGGKVSKGSQGLSGAREMFATQQRLGEVL